MALNRVTGPARIDAGTFPDRDAVLIAEADEVIPDQRSEESQGFGFVHRELDFSEERLLSLPQNVRGGRGYAHSEIVCCGLTQTAGCK